MELAAYHGLSNVLVLLFGTSSSLKKNTSQRNAVFSAFRNGQHTALDIILSKRRNEALKVVQEEAIVAVISGRFISTLMETIMKSDVVST